MSLLGLNFDDCITDISKPLSDFLVIYPADENNILENYNDISYGYFKAANMIVDKMYSSYGKAR